VEKARLAIAQSSIRFGGRHLSVTCSGGLAELTKGDGEKDAVRRADEALYEAKKAGRNCAFCHDGRSSHRILAEQVATPVSGAERVGDEWLFEAEAAQSQVREPLATVSSRPAFFDDMIRRLSHWRREGSPLALMLVQVDGFSRIGSDHGPGAAEVVLRVAAQLLSAVMRDMDHCTRLSEDTFALLLPGAHLIDAVQIGERLRHAVERCRLPRKAGANWFTISVGVIEAGDGDDLRRILERGRKALQTAVNSGRNRVVGQELHSEPAAAISGR
jgi:diguanylate cyclase